MTTLLLASTAVVTAAALLASPRESADCRPVDGTISARVTDIGVTLRGLRATGSGSSSGDLPGRVFLEAVRSPGRPHFELELHITTPDGELTLAGRATASDGDGQGPERLLDGRLSVQRGTRAYAHAGGSVVARGSANTDDRRATVQYSGSLCVAGGR